jgi:hypothetical protein
MAGTPGPRRIGRPPRNLSATVSYRQAQDGTQVAMSVMDVVEETMAAGGFLKDAAARVGLTAAVLREWRTLGAKARADVLQGARKFSDLSARERQCAELDERITRAEADARAGALATLQHLGRGGIEVVTETVRTRPDGRQERTRKVERTLPDSHALTWFLQHRHPEDFNRSTVTVTGHEGGPVQVDVRPALDRLLDKLAAVREQQQSTGADALQEALAAGARVTHANGTGVNGNGNGAHAHS